MRMNNKIVVTETLLDDENLYIKNLKIDGYFMSKYRENLLQEESEDTVNHILSNSYQAVNCFKNTSETSNQKTVKILCLGKVQSGKTSFFLSTIALAFDNGYDVAYLLGGTKLNLKKQNLGRVIDSFKNNEKVKIIDVTKGFNDDISEYIDKGYKLILVILKNAAKKVNLGQLKEMSNKYSEIPSIVIDDEGDEFTPGSPKGKKKTNKTHDSIVDIINNFKLCTFLSVTATPQANLLLPTMDELSPDRLVLVHPGKGYTGGQEFFDNNYNPHVIRISDADDFENSIPDTFKDALHFFIVACAIKRKSGDVNPFSMLVHPSSFNVIQDIVATRITNYYNNVIMVAHKNKKSIKWSTFKEVLDEQLSNYKKDNTDYKCNIDDLMDEISTVLNNLDIQIVNYSNTQNEDENDSLYQIKVGGNMLGRGLTINRLIVSYIYRDSKEPAVDTMYQRCRWFGYKQKYFDVCKVYMTGQLQDRFIAIVNHETQMWISMDAFLNTQINLKKFKRLFALNNDDLILTRKTVSNTITLKMISFGNRADECIDISKNERDNNINVVNDFISKYKSIGQCIDFDTSTEHRQNHLVIKLKFSDLFGDLLSKLIFATESPFDIAVFAKYLDEIHSNNRVDEMTVMIMRHNTYENRSSEDAGVTISRLFQGRNDNTNFTGDRYPKDINGFDYTKIPFIQIHMIMLDNEKDKTKAFPLLSFNNPYTNTTIKLVTGDNLYE